MASARKKKTRVRTTADADLFKMYGLQPEYTKNPDTDPEYNSCFTHALNWTSRGVESTDAKKELVLWVQTKFTKEAASAVRQLTENELGNTGRIAYLANNNFALSSAIEARLKERVATFIEKGKAIAKQKKVTDKADAKLEQLKKDNTVSAAEQNAIDSCEIFDIAADNIDDFDSDKFKVKIDGQKAIVLQKVIEDISLLKNDYLFAKDDDEAFSGYGIGKRVLNARIKKLDEIVNLLEAAKMNKTVTRKPRVKKAKSALQQTLKLKYKAEDKELNINSIDPMAIIGATKLVVFNTKYRKLGIYHAGNELGFSVKGTTIQNIDEEKSLQKTLRDTKNRKTVDVLNDMRKAASKRSDKIFAELKSVEYKLTGRINDDVLLLKIYK